MGERALKTKPDKKEQEKARERVNSSQGKPVNSRSNASVYRAPRGQESIEQMEERLGNVTF